MEGILQTIDSSPYQSDYTLPVDLDSQSVTLMPTINHDHSTMTINGKVQESGKDFRQDLQGNRITTTIVITSQSGESHTYTFTFKRLIELPNNSLIAHYTMKEITDEAIVDETNMLNDVRAQNVLIDKEQFKTGDRSALFNGENSRLTLSDGNGIDFGKQDFTASMWIYSTDLKGQKFPSWYGGANVNLVQWWYVQAEKIYNLI